MSEIVVSVVVKQTERYEANVVDSPEIFVALQK